MALDLKELGLTQEELQERVVERICDTLLDGTGTDDYGEEHADLSPWRERLDGLVRQRIDAKVEEMACREVLPRVGEMIEGLVLHRTNEWGEKKGGHLTFIEYLVQRAEAYLREPVTRDGKRPDSYSGATQERIAHMVDQHLHDAIEKAMKEAVRTANDAIVAGLAETVKMKLEEIAKGLRVAVEVKR